MGLSSVHLLGKGKLSSCQFYERAAKLHWLLFLHHIFQHESSLGFSKNANPRSYSTLI